MLRVLCFSLMCLFGMSACNKSPTVQPAELAASMKSGNASIILDVRTVEEYDAGHIPGAILIPHDELESRIAELGNPRPVVVYCKSGRRAGLAESILLERGFSVKLLDGSWQAWQAAKLPEESTVKR